MKCPKPDCGVENRDGAKFCRACGSELIKNEVPVMERFPEYSFSPTSITKIKGKSDYFTNASLVFFFLTLVFFFADLEMLQEEGVNGLTILFFFPVIIFLLFAILYFKRTSYLDLSSEYDYVETTNNKPYRFVIKNSKFGVYNIESEKLAIPCEYDYLKWKSQDKILTAAIGNDVFDIDIYGNRLK